MLYENSIKNNILVLGICTLLFLLSPAQSIPVSIETVQAKEIKTTTGSYYSGVVSNFQTGGGITQKEGTGGTNKILSGGKSEYRNVTKTLESKKENGTGKLQENTSKGVFKGKIECGADCNIKTLVSLGIAPKIAGSLVYTCKETAIDAVKCIKLGASIAMAESGGGLHCYKQGCFGIKAGKIAYETVEDGVEDWVARYNKWWYKQENPSGFYSNSPDWKPRTHYCLSEDSSGKNYCPNGFSHSWSMWNKISKVF